MSERKIQVTEVDTVAENDEFIQGMMAKIAERRMAAETGTVADLGTELTENNGFVLSDAELDHMREDGQELQTSGYDGGRRA